MKHTTSEIDLVAPASIDSRSATRGETLEFVVVGAGGHGRELADIVKAAGALDQTVSLLGIVDDGSPDLGMLARSGLRFLGPVSAIADRAVALMIGVGDPGTRERIDQQLPDLAGPTLAHPTAVVGTSNSLSPGVVLAQGVIVTTNVAIGRHSHVDVAASISHDCIIGDYVTISPGARIAGAVTIGDRAFIGIGATVLPGINIAPDAMIAAGAVVCHDVQPGAVVRGVPAR